MPQRANLDEANYQLESCMRENRTYSSEGGDGREAVLYPYRPGAGRAAMGDLLSASQS
jgi:hypothetical protein